MITIGMWLSGASWGATCGNGSVEGGESCDDGNTTGGDGCSAGCAVEPGYDCVQGDFSLLSADVFDDPEQVHSDPVWDTSDDLLTATELENSTATVYATTMAPEAFEIEVEVEVETSEDDDFVGFVFGYEPGDATSGGADFLLVSWKQATQSIGQYGGSASEGLSVSRVTGQAEAGDLWTHTGPVDELQRSNDYAFDGWNDNTPYTFRFVYSASDLDVYVDGDLQLSIGGVFPTGGKFGLFAFSQMSSRFTLLEPSGESVCDSPDTDGDGLDDAHEIGIGTDPDDFDTDGDTIGDGTEVNVSTTDPTDPDTDGDGLDDAAELGPDAAPGDGETDPLDADSDDDGRPDGDEVGGPVLSDPLVVDSDGDGISDGVEVGATGPVAPGTSADGSPYGGTDGVFVGDADPATTTDPFDPDTDDDGLLDGQEDADHSGSVEGSVGETGTAGSGETDPNDPDTDGDLLLDGDEPALGTDPRDADTDDGGVWDGVEVNTDATDPVDGTDDHADLDGDGLDAPTEDGLGTDPLDPDSDDDGLTDGQEVNDTDTDPLDPDTDQGGIFDGAEVEAGADPLDAADDAEIDADGDGVPDVQDALGKYFGGACTGCDGGGAPSVGWLALPALLVARRRRVSPR
ncbi:MAG: hypothetical protein ABMA64_11330 [Myxococcota bacterium]